MSATASPPRPASEGTVQIAREVRKTTEQRLFYYMAHPGEIDERIRELDQEWSLERALEAQAGSMALLGFGLGSLFSRVFYALPLLAAGFLLQHAIRGWTPPLLVLRRLGVRTREEIEAERFALKALRGDFEDVGRVEHGSVSLERPGHLLRLVGQ